MSNVRWIKIVVNIFDDEKIRLLETLPDGDSIIVIWFKLLTMAGKCNDSGVVYLSRDIPYNIEMLSTIMRRPANTIRLALSEFAKLGMISIENDFISLLNWEKYQTLDQLEMAKEQTRKRVARHREKQKQICNVTVTLPVTQCNGNRLDKDIDKDIDKEYNRGRFAPPSVDDVQSYLDEKCITQFTASKFIDFYESKGWMIGKNKMKDWRAAVRTWMKRYIDEIPQKSFRDRNAAIDNLPPEQQEAYRKQMEQELKQILNKPRKITNDTE